MAVFIDCVKGVLVVAVIAAALLYGWCKVHPSTCQPVEGVQINAEP